MGLTAAQRMGVDLGSVYDNLAQVLEANEQLVDRVRSLQGDKDALLLIVATVGRTAISDQLGGHVPHSEEEWLEAAASIDWRAAVNRIHGEADGSASS